MKIEISTEKDLPFLSRYDHHISKEELAVSISRGRILMLKNEQGEAVGWLRWNLFWDNIPFMNLLFLLEDYRGKGYGKMLVHFWEDAMRKEGFSLVMTSTQSDEEAQHFYRKLGYRDAGALLLPEEVLEIMLIKKISFDAEQGEVL